MRRHDTDVTSLVFGLLFAGIAGLWALIAYDVLSWPDARVAGPGLLVVAGVVGVAVTLGRSGRNRRTVRAAEASASASAAVHSDHADTLPDMGRDDDGRDSEGRPIG